MESRNDMNGLLANKKALVCGVANRNSIAWAVANAFRAHGADVALTCLEPSLKRVSKMSADAGFHQVFPCDVRRDESVARAFDEAGRVFGGRLDILVHSLAFAPPEDLGGEFIRTSRESWNVALDVSAYSLVAMARCARPLFARAGGGSIMAMAFIGSRSVVPGYNVMGVAKAALECVVRYLAYDLGPERIRVNGISPGPVRTASALMIEDFDRSLDLVGKSSPLCRNVSLDEVANTVVFLASGLSSGITGSLLTPDAGMSIVAPPGIPHPRPPRPDAGVPGAAGAGS